VTTNDLPPDRLAAWLRGGAAAGWPLPLGLARDLGLLLSRPPDQRPIARPAHLSSADDTASYLAFLERLAALPLVRELPDWRPAPTDAVLAVLLTRLIESLSLPDVYRLPAGDEGAALTRNLAQLIGQTDAAKLWAATDPAQRPDWNRLLPPEALARIEVNLRGLDRDEVRFLVQYGPSLPGTPDPRDLLDLLSLTGLPPAVRLALGQSLRLLPHLTGPRGGGQQTYPEGGYEGLARRGSLDSLLPTELAYHAELLLHRVHNGEALYYGRERPRERRRELAYVVAQAGLGLGGDGQVLARALLLALGQAMRRRGYEVQYSFAGAALAGPRPLDRPGEIGRVLYHREAGGADAAAVLSGVLRHLKGWRDEYRVRQVLWVLSEHFDADCFDEHEELYRALRHEAGQQVWYVRVGPAGRGGAAPATAKLLGPAQVVETRVMWQEVGVPGPGSG
jgi:hypothetical protein